MLSDGLVGWDEEAPLDVAEFMNPWVLQQSFPVVTVQKTSDSALTLCQQPYNARSTLPPSPFNYQWYVPLLIEGGAGGKARVWLTPQGSFLPLTSVTDLVAR